MDPSSAPLADYFWIAGIENVTYSDLPTSPTTTQPQGANGHTSFAEESTIVEGSEDEASDNEPILGSAPRSGSGAARHSRNSSFNRLSRLSVDARNLIQNIESLELNGSTKSARSSMTVRAAPSNGTSQESKTGLSDFDFDRALVKFANERESFLDDLSFSAGTVLHSRPPMTARAERLRVEDAETGYNGGGGDRMSGMSSMSGISGYGNGNGGINGRKSPLQRVGGSIRRKISFRDLNSAKKAPVNRAGRWLFLSYWSFRE